MLRQGVPEGQRHAHRAGISRPAPLNWAAVVLASLVPQFAGAAPPQVIFDVTPVVACRDVTPEEFAAANPDERLVEARLQVSSLIHSGDEDDLLQYFYRFVSPAQSLRFADYTPKTTLASDVAGNVSIEKKKETTKGIGMTLSGPSDLPIKVAGSGDVGAKSLDAVRYDLVPPMTAVAASGTILRGYGVYFKLRPSRGTSLEGEKEFTLVLRVPRGWRNDFLHLSCTASGVQKGVVPPLNENIVSGRRQFLVALYAEGDAAAKTAAERLADAEWALVKTIAAHRREIENRCYPTIAHKVGMLLEVIPPNLPHDWAERVLYGPPLAETDPFTRRLPEEVREAVVEYTIARREFSSLPAGEAARVQ
jgi:hypothetical protein